MNDLKHGVHSPETTLRLGPTSESSDRVTVRGTGLTVQWTVELYSLLSFFLTQCFFAERGIKKIISTYGLKIVLLISSKVVDCFQREWSYLTGWL